ncbi:hypothetical protein C8J57DRAFT_1220010 [Mycena rebaudengoi]|nr:hypothetical protein C8J57DRAFT_1220010 [Mycena rebaudengoi]
MSVASSWCVPSEADGTRAAELCSERGRASAGLGPAESNGHAVISIPSYPIPRHLRIAKKDGCRPSQRKMDAHLRKEGWIPTSARKDARSAAAHVDERVLLVGLRSRWEDKPAPPSMSAHRVWSRSVNGCAGANVHPQEDACAGNDSGKRVSVVVGRAREAAEFGVYTRPSILTREERRAKGRKQVNMRKEEQRMSDCSRPAACCSRSAACCDPISTRTFYTKRRVSTSAK